MDTSAAASATMTDAIDALLERYLGLLHEYGELRAELSALQAGVYADIARANFAAERGLRYGADHYDGRMRASRRLRLRVGSGDGYAGEDTAPVFTVVHVGDGDEKANGSGNGSAGVASPAAPDTEEGTPESEARKEDEVGEGDEQGWGSSDVKSDDGSNNSNDNNGTKQAAENEEVKEKRRDKKKAAPRNDPLRWFGLLAPAALRQAQARSVRAVEELVPRLASVDAEMARLEIEVRRARKRRAKAEKASASPAVVVAKSQEQEVEALAEKAQEITV